MHARLTAAAFLLTTSLSQAQTTLYRVDYVDGGKGTASFATGQNEQGQIVGAFDHGRFTWPARLDREATAIIAQERSPKPRKRPGTAYAINGAGTVAGMAWTGTPLVQTPFVTVGAHYRLLNTPRGVAGTAVGVNASGMVAGNLMPEFEPHRAAVHDGEQWRHLVVPEGSQDSQAYAINDAGMIAGWARTPQGQFAVRWNAARQPEYMQGLGGGGDHAFAINQAGVMAGESTPPSGYPWTHAVIYRDGVAIDLDGREKGISMAWGINASEQVVGSMLHDGLYHAIIAGPGRPMRRLDDLLVPSQRGQWHVSTAFAINDAGQIVGHGLRNGDPAYYRAVRLTPVTSD